MTDDTLKAVVIAFIALLPVAVLKVYDIQPVMIVIAGCLCILLYYITLYFRDEKLKKLVTDIFVRRN